MAGDRVVPTLSPKSGMRPLQLFIGVLLFTAFEMSARSGLATPSDTILPKVCSEIISDARTRFDIRDADLRNFRNQKKKGFYPAIMQTLETMEQANALMARSLSERTLDVIGRYQSALTELIKKPHANREKQTEAFELMREKYGRELMQNLALDMPDSFVDVSPVEGTPAQPLVMRYKNSYLRLLILNSTDDGLGTRGLRLSATRTWSWTDRNKKWRAKFKLDINALTGNRSFGYPSSISEREIDHILYASQEDTIELHVTSSADVVRYARNMFHAKQHPGTPMECYELFESQY